MAAPYRTAEPPDDRAERAELAAFERRVTSLPGWLRVTTESRSMEMLLHAVTIQLLMVIASAAPLRDALFLPAFIMGLPSVLMLAKRIRERRRRP